MSKKLNKLVDINRLREFKNKLVGAFVQTGAVDQTVAGTKTFFKPIVGSVTGSSGSCTGNSATATKLATVRKLWGNNFDGSAAITGTITGTPGIEFMPPATTANNGGVLDFHYNQSTADYTSRIIESASGTLSINYVTITTGRVVTAATFNGALKGNVTGNCSGSSGSCTGNAATATKLQTARTINGTGFDGTANITTANWGTARNISITDGTNTSTAVSVNGSANVSLNLPATIKANLTGNCSGSSGSCTGNAASANIATKATQDAAGNTITTTYVTKTEASKTYVTKTDAAKTYATKSEIIVHAGVIIPFAGTSVPTGYLLCNGAAVSRTNYANLFAAIGTRYGAGNGSTTFNLPDARDRVLQGASGTHSVGSYIAAGLPNITGTVANGSGFFTYKSGNGAFSVTGDPAYANGGTGGPEACHPNFDFNAHKSNALYGASNTVQSPAIATNFIIKY